MIPPLPPKAIRRKNPDILNTQTRPGISRAASLRVKSLLSVNR